MMITNRMDSSNTADVLQDFELDMLAQQSRINRLYTQLTFCIPITNDAPDRRAAIVEILRDGFHLLSASFPWVAGNVVNERGTFKIKRDEENASRVTVKDLRQHPSFPTWDVLQRSNFPFSMLDETIIAPRKTLAVQDPTKEEALPVFLIQANFIEGGLLLTFNGQHGAMDMAGLSEVMRLFAKACRKEAFTAEELEVGNRRRRDVVALLGEYEMESELNRVRSETAAKERRGRDDNPPVECTWAYFSFCAETLATLKARAMKMVPRGSTTTFVSTDDVLSVFIWQSITRARLPRLENVASLTTTLSRNVDVRRHLSLPLSYPGFVTHSTSHTLSINNLLDSSLGATSSQLRAALDPASLAYGTRRLATLIARHETTSSHSFAANSVPELDVRLSSWAKERCYELDFGVGEVVAVRRPAFREGAREGLVYFLPRKGDGEMVVGVCLRGEDVERLKEVLAREQVRFIG